MLPRDCPDVDKECRPSNSMIGSTDRQIVYLLLLQPLLLLAMLGVMMMPTTPTLGFMILYLCLSCQVTFACTIFIIGIVIICTSPDTVHDTPYSVHLGEACLLPASPSAIWSADRKIRSSAASQASFNVTVDPWRTM